MNKKLMALAVAGAFAAPAAMAQTNVTLYGTAAMSVDYVDGGSGGAATATSENSDSRLRVSSNTSLFGLRITEDLGNGLSARAQLETAINIDTGGGIGWGGTTGNRNNFVGFASKNWGSLDFGLIDTPLKTSTASLDLFGGGHTIADYRSLFTTRDSSIREANSIYYTSPTWSGFTVRAQYGARKEAGSSKSPDFWGVSAQYQNGPIFATLAYEDGTKVGTSATTSVFDAGGGTTGIGGYNVTTGSAYSLDTTTWRAGFGYNFGVARVGIAYENLEHDLRNDGGATVTGNGIATIAIAAGAGGKVERDSWHLSGGWNITKATMIGLQYTRANKLEVNNSKLSNSGASQWTLGVRHDLSKRTNVYALYTQVRNDSAASYQLGGGATGTAAIDAAATGQDPRAFSMGVVHRF